MRIRMPVVWCLSVAAWLVAAPSFAEHHMSNPGHGPVIAHPRIVNLYWHTDWDSANPGFSRAAVDDATRKLMSSRYLDKAAQYGVQGGSFHSKSFQSSCLGSPAATITSGDVFGWVSCMVGKSSGVPLPDGDTVYVVWLPMSARVVNPSLFHDDSCKPRPNGFDAYHAPGPGFTYVVIPITSPCVNNMDDLTRHLSHEIVEAATDPMGRSWRDETGAGRDTVISDAVTLLNYNEIADACEEEIATVRVNGVAVASYWSNADRACAAGTGTVAALTSAIRVSPTAPTATDLQSLQFGAAGGKVVWSMAPGSLGSIDASGRYTAPDSIAALAPAWDVVQASAADGSGRSGSAIVCLRPRPVLQADSNVVQPRQSEQLRFSGGLDAQNLYWSVGGDGSIDQGGVFTAPAAASARHTTTVMVTGSDACGTDLAAQAPITLALPSLVVSPDEVNVVEGGGQIFAVSQTQGHKVNWSVSNADAVARAGSFGTIDQSGRYQAPSRAPGDQHLHVTARSDDGRVTTVHLKLLTGLRVDPPTSFLSDGGTQTFFVKPTTAAGGECHGNNGASFPCPGAAPPVTWSLVGAGALTGNSYRAPAKVAAGESATVVATAADGRIARAPIHLLPPLRVIPAVATLSVGGAVPLQLSADLPVKWSIKNGGDDHLGDPQSPRRVKLQKMVADWRAQIAKFDEQIKAAGTPPAGAGAKASRPNLQKLAAIDKQKRALLARIGPALAESEAEIKAIDSVYHAPARLDAKRTVIVEAVATDGSARKATASITICPEGQHCSP